MYSKSLILCLVLVSLCISIPDSEGLHKSPFQPCHSGICDRRPTNFQGIRLGQVNSSTTITTLTSSIGGSSSTASSIGGSSSTASSTVGSSSTTSSTLASSSTSVNTTSTTSASSTSASSTSSSTVLNTTSSSSTSSSTNTIVSSTTKTIPTTSSSSSSTSSSSTSSTSSTSTTVPTTSSSRSNSITYDTFTSSSTISSSSTTQPTSSSTVKTTSSTVPTSSSSTTTTTTTSSSSKSSTVPTTSTTTYSSSSSKSSTVPTTTTTTGPNITITPPPFSNNTDTCNPLPLQPSVDLTRYGLMLCPQVCSFWCWATTIAETVQYLTGKTTGYCALNECYEANILRVLNKGFSNVDCCVNGCYTNGCNVGAQPDQMPQVLAANGINSELLKRALTENEVKTELSQYRPIIMGFTDFSSGHVVLLYGFNTVGSVTYYLVSDPWPNTLGGAGLTGSYTFNQIQTYAGKPWTLSIWHMAGDQRCSSSGVELIRASLLLIFAMLGLWL